MIAERMLQQLGVSPDELMPVIENIRDDGYKLLRSYHHGDKVATKRNVGETFLHTTVVQESDYFNGKLIGELDLKRFEVVVKTLRRGDIRGDHPDEEMLLQAGDTLVLEGQAGDFKAVETYLRSGGKVSKTNPTDSKKTQDSPS